MTVQHNRPIATIASIIRIARRNEDERLDKVARGVIKKRKYRTPECIAVMGAACDERRRLGIKFAPRAEMFKGLRRSSPIKGLVALTASQIKASNRERLKTAAADFTARKRKAEIDAANPTRRSAHSNDHTEPYKVWKQRKHTEREER
jgi:hypothetical protein